MAESIFETASRRADVVYDRLEPRPDGTADRVYLRLEELLTELNSEAMHAIGAEAADGGLDPVAEEIFGETRNVLGQVAQELAEHVFKSTRRYLNARLVEAPNVVNMVTWLERSARRGGLS